MKKPGRHLYQKAPPPEVRLTRSFGDRHATNASRILYAFQTNTVTLDFKGKSAAQCRLPALPRGAPGFWLPPERRRWSRQSSAHQPGGERGGRASSGDGTVTKDPPDRPPQRQTHGITQHYPAPRRIRRMESNRSRAAARCRSRSLRCPTSRVTSSGRTLRLTF